MMPDQPYQIPRIYIKIKSFFKEREEPPVHLFLSPIRHNFFKTIPSQINSCLIRHTIIPNFYVFIILISVSISHQQMELSRHLVLFITSTLSRINSFKLLCIKEILENSYPLKPNRRKYYSHNTSYFYYK